MKTCYIMRGLPGSGKSTIASHIVGNRGIIHSTDTLRIIDGVYKFDPKETAPLHAENLDNFRCSIDSGRYDVVICDNTNMKHWEYYYYQKYAKDAGYQVVIVTVTATPWECAHRNIHNVSLEVIERMAKNWEPI